MSLVRQFWIFDLNVKITDLVGDGRPNSKESCHFWSTCFWHDRSPYICLPACTAKKCFFGHCTSSAMNLHCRMRSGMVSIRLWRLSALILCHDVCALWNRVFSDSAGRRPLAELFLLDYRPETFDRRQARAVAWSILTLVCTHVPLWLVMTNPVHCIEVSGFIQPCFFHNIFRTFESLL